MGRFLTKASLLRHKRLRDSGGVRGKYDGDFYFFKGTILKLLVWLWHIVSVVCNRSYAFISEVFPDMHRQCIFSVYDL